MSIKIKFTGFPEIKKGHLALSSIKSDYNATSRALTYKGEEFYPICGEIHLSRYDEEFWEEEIIKMKTGGLNCIASYIFWNMHETAPHQYDFSGNRNIAKFLSLCKKHEMPVFLRIGPWCHGEVVYGGFPKWINFSVGIRTNNAAYLEQVRLFWVALHNEVKEYLDGKTVFMLQLENEFGGSVAHLQTLRKMAIEIGFCVPYFAMTAWPMNKPVEGFLPLVGGYPDAPWSHLKRKLKPQNRFAIVRSRSEAVIGEDLNKMQKAAEAVFDDYPYASCEVGAGNHVSQHRRPIIDTKAACGIVFSKVASGMNTIGYYMYHGCSNPTDKLYQESRITLYPNNHQIVDYDFQAPLDRYGYARQSYHRLRLFHYMINQFDNNFVAKTPFFLEEQPNGFFDTKLRASIRMDDDFSGYIFVCNYERNLEMQAHNDVEIKFLGCENKLSLPTINVAKDDYFAMPFNFKVGDKIIDYVTATAVAKLKDSNGTTLYFEKIDNNDVKISIGGKVTNITKFGEVGFVIGEGTNKISVFVMEKEMAETFYIADGKAVFNKNIFIDANRQEKITKTETSANKYGIKLSAAPKQELPFDRYLFSYGKKNFYELSIPKNVLDGLQDIVLEFDFDGAALQMFADGKIINDYFNYDRKFVVSLKYYAKYIKAESKIIIKTAPQKKLGNGRFYNEINLPFNKANLTLTTIKTVEKV